MTHNSIPFSPDWEVSPGATIASALKNRSLSTCDLAELLEIEEAEVNLLLDGQLDITAALADELSVAFGNSPSFWLNRQFQYEASAKYSSNYENKGSLRKWLSMFPKNDMEKFGWVSPASTLEARTREILDFFGASSIEDWYQKNQSTLSVAAFRTTLAFEPNPVAVASWLRAAEMAAERIECQAWDSSAFRQVLVNARKLTRWNRPERFLPALQTMCASAGVAVVVVPAPKGCLASGATRFLEETKALIVLSLRYKTDDQFWFTFFHESGHLLLHESESIFLEDGSEVTEVEEEEANKFAEEIILPGELSQELEALPARAKPVIRFAVRTGISPGLVVGQMQHKGIISFKQLNSLKRRFSWAAFSA